VSDQESKGALPINGHFREEKGRSGICWTRIGAGWAGASISPISTPSNAAEISRAALAMGTRSASAGIQLEVFLKVPLGFFGLLFQRKGVSNIETIDRFPGIQFDRAVKDFTGIGRLHSGHGEFSEAEVSSGGLFVHLEGCPVKRVRPIKTTFRYSTSPWKATVSAVRGNPARRVSTFCISS
jgi:hypothetical protein